MNAYAESLKLLNERGTNLLQKIQVKYPNAVKQ